MKSPYVVFIILFSQFLKLFKSFKYPDIIKTEI